MGKSHQKRLNSTLKGVKKNDFGRKIKKIKGR